jgi:hypothetical protein
MEILRSVQAGLLVGDGPREPFVVRARPGVLYRTMHLLHLIADGPGKRRGG